MTCRNSSPKFPEVKKVSISQNLQGLTQVYIYIYIIYIYIHVHITYVYIYIYICRCVYIYTHLHGCFLRTMLLLSSPKTNAQKLCDISEVLGFNLPTIPWALPAVMFDLWFYWVLLSSAEMVAIWKGNQYMFCQEIQQTFEKQVGCSLNWSRVGGIHDWLSVNMNN